MSKLDNIPKKNNFKVPDNYFSSLENDIKGKVSGIDDSKKLSNYQLIKPYIYLAAGMLALVMLIRLGLEIGIGDYKSQQKFTVSETVSDYYKIDLIENLLSDDSFFLEYYYLYEDEDYSLYAEDYEYIEDYLSQYAYEFEYYE